MRKSMGWLVVVTLTLGAVPAFGQTDDADEVDQKDRAFVTQGIYDKPFITEFGDRIRVGGYVDIQHRYEREEGLTSEQSFLLERFNLFTYTPLSERLRVAAEIEFEEGGEEVKIELAVVDFEIHPALTFRGGVILSPLGRFNLAHDGPANQLVDRPLVSTKIIPTTLSEPGMGFLGAFYPGKRVRVTYEAYAVNGLSDDIIADGVRISEGKANFEDNNSHPSFVGRLAVSPTAFGEVAASVHTGPYNTFKEEGVAIDKRRDVTILALDGEYRVWDLTFTGEYAHASIDIQESLVGLFAEKQHGIYLEGSFVFLSGMFSELPRSAFRSTVRYDYVDFDRDIDGDDERLLTVGLNFRPIEDTVFKLDYWFGWETDRFDNQAKSAGILFGIASYF